MRTQLQNLTDCKGRKIANQFEINTPEGTFFQSYETIIAVKRSIGKVELDINKWNCSKTTSKYRSIFLGETTKETQKKIDSGIYTLVNLNN